MDTLATVSRRALVRFILLPLAAVVLVAAGAGVWAWNEGRRSTQVSEGDALADFRAGGSGGTVAGGPAPGVYTYDQEGREAGGIGPVSIERDLPAEARYSILAVPGGYQEELALAAEHMEAVRFEPVAGGGRRAVWRRTDITFVGVGRDDRRDLTPPPVDRPAGMRVGSTWTSRYMAGELSVVSRSEVLRAEAVRVGDRDLPALVIRTVGDTTGAHPGRRTDVVWWSDELRMPLRWSIDMRVRGVARIDTRTELRLRDATPRT